MCVLPDVPDDPLNFSNSGLPSNSEKFLFHFAFKRHQRWPRRQLLNLQNVSLRRFLLAALMSS
jgi:hypothetical protein